MKWDPSHQSSDVEDRRGQGGGGGGGGGLPLGFLISLLFRTKYGWIIVLLGLGVYAVQRFVIAPKQAQNPAQLASGDREAHFVAFVLDDAQQFWDTELPRETKTPYRHAKLVLFTDSTPTACGLGDAATGPFYCPGDEQVYIDLGFFQVLSDRLGAHGEFARGYVVAHEIGHHVQKILGIENGKSHAKGATGGSVRLELQADCYAGIWARSANDRKLLEPGDLQSALDAASRIGDDVLQQQSGRVRPESFTHGTAKQRYTWLKKGYDTGSVGACDTFSAPTL
jgi:predicted metalloprotease